MVKSRKLTNKQRAFADAVISGKAYADAYREAYDCEAASDATVRRNSRRIAALEQVDAAIKKGVSKANKKAVWSRQMALERLQRINDDTYSALTDHNDDEEGRLLAGVYFRDQYNAFVGTLDRLNDLTNIDRGVGFEPVVIVNGFREAAEVGASRVIIDDIE